jgi:hypothetical protein
MNKTEAAALRNVFSPFLHLTLKIRRAIIIMNIEENQTWGKQVISH